MKTGNIQAQVLFLKCTHTQKNKCASTQNAQTNRTKKATQEYENKQVRKQTGITGWDKEHVFVCVCVCVCVCVYIYDLGILFCIQAIQSVKLLITQYH